MALTVMNNPSSVSAQRFLSYTQRGLEKAIGHLASGLRIVRASDDAAGLAISEGLRSQIRSLAMCRRNAADGISMAQTAEGALNEVHGALTRMRELAIQSANGTLGTGERTLLQNEFAALRSEINRIADVTEFNGFLLLDAAGSIALQVGTYDGVDHRLTVILEDTHAVGLAAGLPAATIATQAGARSALTVLDTAIDSVSGTRGAFGVLQNRLEMTIDRLATAEENTVAAESRIRDADIAQETSLLTRAQILTQSGVAMLAQANQIPMMGLSLIA